MPASTRRIEAAGGVLWRPSEGPSGDPVEVALVHRPKYDDWSLPKGKLASGEHPLLGALREVEEETGQRGVPGRPLGETNYLKDGTPKRVRYWALHAGGGTFVPGAEVDQLIWLPPREARRYLSPERDQGILDEFARDGQASRACVLVRHGSAGERSVWSGDDRERPLDDVGREQAQALIPFLEAYQVTRVLSADVLRCLDTVGPYASRHGLAVDSEPLLSEAGVASQPGAAVIRLRAILAAPEPVAVCSQGKAMPELIAGICRTLGYMPPPDVTTRKAGFWVLHVAVDEPLRLIGLERFGPVR